VRTTSPATRPVSGPKSIRPAPQVKRTRARAASANGSRSETSSKRPRTFAVRAGSQYASGGFWSLTSPFILGITQSPERHISRDVTATRSSTMSDTSMVPIPQKKIGSDATTSTAQERGTLRARRAAASSIVESGAAPGGLNESHGWALRASTGPGSSRFLHRRR
jgi:hypothetical protein